VQAAEIVILAVGTPSLPSGEANLSYIEEAACELPPRTLLLQYKTSWLRRSAMKAYPPPK
jgi:UDP-glucose 6-dehydrogenase